MAKDGHWMEKAFANSHGQLHKAAGLPKGQKIPVEELHKLANSASIKTRHRAQLVLNADH